MRDKLVALALDFEGAPQSLKDAMVKLRAAYVAVEKADHQIGLWNTEKVRARKEFDKMNRDFMIEVEKFDPANKKDKKLEEMPGVE